MKYPIKPYLYASEPETFLVNSEQIKSIPLFSDEKVEIPELEKDQVIYFEKDRDDDCYLVVYRETKVPNPNYEKQLAVYNEAKADYDVQLAQYNKELNEFHQAQLEEKTKQEKAEYERLKSIYG
jgi:hypothetical protein